MDKEESDFDLSKAEFFEALGHPTRIRMLRALEKGSLGFSELKHSLGLDSNGLLAFHLGKMKEFVKEDSDGKYALSDYGAEALRLSYVLEKPEAGDGRSLRISKVSNGRGLTGKMVLGGLIAVMIVLAAFAGLMVARDMNQETQINQLNTKLTGDNSLIAVLKSNQTAYEAQLQASELKYSGLQNEYSALQNTSARLQLELSQVEDAYQQISKLSMTTFYVDDTMTVAANSTVLLTAFVNSHNGTIVFLSPNGCNGEGAESPTLVPTYVLDILLLPGSNSTTYGGYTAFYVPIDTQTNQVYVNFKNMGSSPAQCIFSLFYIYNIAS